MKNEAIEAAIVPMEQKAPAVASVTPMTLVQMAVEQGADVDRLAKLYELQVQWEKNEAKKAFDQAMATFRAKCPAIKKTRQAHNSKYAGLAETLATIQPLMSDCGLSHSWRTEQQAGGSIMVKCIVTHVQGHSEETSMFAEADKSGSKNSIQAVGSTTTYLQRYTLYSILGLASTDHDDDGNASGSMALVDVATMMEGATTLAELDSVARNALNLSASDKAKARKIYEEQKKRMNGQKGARHE